MKKRIPGIIVFVLGIFAGFAVPALGGLLIIVGVVMMVFAGKKSRNIGPAKYRVEVFEDSARSVMKRNPYFERPRNYGKPVYEYMFFEEPCTVEKTQVKVKGVTIGTIDKSLASKAKGEQILRLYGGKRLMYDGKDWMMDEIPFRGELIRR